MVFTEVIKYETDTQYNMKSECKHEIRLQNHSSSSILVGYIFILYLKFGWYCSTINQIAS